MTPSAIHRQRVLVDFVLVVIAWLAAWALRRALDPYFVQSINPLPSYLVSAPLVATLWVLSTWVFGLYRVTRAAPLARIQQLLRHALLVLLVLCSVSFMLKEYQIGRAVVLIGWLLALLLQVLHLSILQRLGRNRSHTLRTLVLGASTTGVRALQKLQDAEHEVVGFLDDDPALQQTRVGDLPVFGGLEQLEEVVRREGIEQVVTALPTLDKSKLLSLVLACDHLAVSMQLATDAFNVLPSSHTPEFLGEVPLVPLQREASQLYEPVKRLLDFFGALLLLLLTAPLWPWWALRIRLDSRGPIFFKQRRVGQDGREFTLIKFRTMSLSAEAYAEAPRDGNDARITRYGRWLRRSSIDELPNLLNVLAGQLSLVGPRPEMPFIVQDYAEWQRRRLFVKPGITGLWQILGRKDLPMHDNLHYDFYYIYNRSLLLDLSILARTVAAVFSGRGAF